MDSKSLPEQPGLEMMPHLNGLSRDQSVGERRLIFWTIEPSGADILELETSGFGTCVLISHVPHVLVAGNFFKVTLKFFMHLILKFRYFPMTRKKFGGDSSTWLSVTERFRTLYI